MVGLATTWRLTPQSSRRRYDSPGFVGSGRVPLAEGVEGRLSIVNRDLSKLSCDAVILRLMTGQAVSRWRFDMFESDPSAEESGDPLFGEVLWASRG